MLVLTRQQALAVMRKGTGMGAAQVNRAAIIPRITADNQLAVSENVITDPALSEFASTLAQGTMGVSVPSWSTISDDRPYIVVDGKPMFINGGGRAYSLSEVASNVFRFEIRANDFGTTTDSGLGNRRCEIVSLKENGYSAGDTFWMSWASVIGPDHAGMMLTDFPDRFCYSMQVHGPPAKPPVVVVNLGQSQMRILTASDNAADGVQVLKTRYTADLPAAGKLTYFVMAVTLGQSGHLSAWINGVSVYDADTPIGYWTDGGILGYPQWGVYEQNLNTREVMFLANPEWGTGSLLGRVNSPLQVPDVKWLARYPSPDLFPGAGLYPVNTVFYPGGGLYPNTALYPAKT